MTIRLANPIRRAIVLAAGKSSRIQSEVSDIPKPLISIGGRTVLERNLRILRDAGVTDVWINVHHLGYKIEETVGDGSIHGLRVEYSREPVLLGTAGAVKNLQPEVGSEPFVVMYGDNVLKFDLPAMIRNHQDLAPALTIAVFDRQRNPNTGLAGGRVDVDTDGRVLRFVEGGTSDTPLVNAGVYVAEPTVLDFIPANQFCDFGHDVFPALLASGTEIRAHQISGYCLGIDTPEALERARVMLTTFEHEHA